MNNEYSFMSADELIMGFEESRITSHREGGGANYFALDLVLGDYNPDNLARLAHEKGQAQALGYVCDVVVDSLPDEDIFRDAKSSLRNLSSKLYSLFNSKFEWEYLAAASPDVVKRIIKDRKKTPLNEKWHIYSTLNQDEMSDWFRVYRGDLTYMLQNAS